MLESYAHFDDHDQIEEPDVQKYMQIVARNITSNDFSQNRCAKRPVAQQQAKPHQIILTPAIPLPHLGQSRHRLADKFCGIHTSKAAGQSKQVSGQMADFLRPRYGLNIDVKQSLGAQLDKKTTKKKKNIKAHKELNFDQNIAQLNQTFDNFS